MSASKLVRPSAEFETSYLEALREYHEESLFLSQDYNAVSHDFESFVDSLRAERGFPHHDFQDWVEPVPETVLWMVKDDQYIGTLYIRHRLNWHLEKWGGHLSFDIRPSMREKGFGKKMLLKAIPFVNYLGIDKALLTVKPDNDASIRIIESCGGAFQDETAETDQFPALRRYWLDCT